MDLNLVKKTEQLANLKLSDERFTKIAGNLSDILSYLEKLGKKDTKDLPDTFNASGLKNVTIDDKPVEADHLSQKQALQNAPRSYKGYVQVDKVI